jgi:hypothetical protein
MKTPAILLALTTSCNNNSKNVIQGYNKKITRKI